MYPKGCMFCSSGPDHEDSVAGKCENCDSYSHRHATIKRRNTTNRSSTSQLSGNHTRTTSSIRTVPAVRLVVIPVFACLGLRYNSKKLSDRPNDVQILAHHSSLTSSRSKLPCQKRYPSQKGKHGPFKSRALQSMASMETPEWKVAENDAFW